jgi:hypothetical protein
MAFAAETPHESEALRGAPAAFLGLYEHSLKR